MPYNYFGGLKAQQALVQNGEYDEALYISNNRILEGTTFSFFAVENDGKIITSKADGKILRSVTRLVLLSIFKEQKIHAEETDMFIDSISSYKEAFIASANRGVIPVQSIDGNMVGNGQVGDVTKQVMALYEKAINF
jgi:D-alanine transaminase